VLLGARAFGKRTLRPALGELLWSEITMGTAIHALNATSAGRLALYLPVASSFRLSEASECCSNEKTPLAK
jgi:hypothetical protein